MSHEEIGTLIKIVGVTVLVLVALSIPFIFRRSKRPHNTWREKSRYLNAYLDYCQKHRHSDYYWDYQEHRRHMIVWFDPPLVEEFLDRAYSLRLYLYDKGRDPNEALKIWEKLLEVQPHLAAGEDFSVRRIVEAYDQEIRC